MSTYLILVLCMVPAAFVLFVVLNLLHSDRRGAAAAAVSFPLCAVLGFIFAKLFYVLLMESGNIIAWGKWDALFSMEPAHFCFTGGAVRMTVRTVFLRVSTSTLSTTCCIS